MWSYAALPCLQVTLLIIARHGKFGQTFDEHISLAINDTLGVLLKYQDDIGKIQGSEAQRLLNQVKAELAGAATA